ncbi:MTAP family purine nucleoside phosphorylase [Calditrichota bacterium]
MTGILAGTSFSGIELPGEWESDSAMTLHGLVSFYRHDSVIYIPRHGKNSELPPHAINHHANLAVLDRLGADKIVSFGSTGSLKKEIQPGTLVVPNDYFSPFNIVTFSDDRIRITIPGFNQSFRTSVIETLKRDGLKLLESGTYIQTSGPRFETQAEIRWMATIGDVVGMTCASEAILAQELEIPHCIVAMVDNYANGIDADPLTGEMFQEHVSISRATVLTALTSIVKEFRG